MVPAPVGGCVTATSWGRDVMPPRSASRSGRAPPGISPGGCGERLRRPRPRRPRLAPVPGIRPPAYPVACGSRSACSPCGGRAPGAAARLFLGRPPSAPAGWLVRGDGFRCGWCGVARAAVCTSGAALAMMLRDRRAGTAARAGSPRPAEQALEIMRETDAGPFGVARGPGAPGPGLRAGLAAARQLPRRPRHQPGGGGAGYRRGCRAGGLLVPRRPLRWRGCWARSAAWRRRAGAGRGGRPGRPRPGVPGGVRRPVDAAHASHGERARPQSCWSCACRAAH